MGQCHRSAGEMPACEHGNTLRRPRSRLMKATRRNRHGERDATMILLAFRHGLRACELVDLRWDQIEFGRNAALHVRRAKNGSPSVHPLSGEEIRALRKLPREAPHVFVSERGAPFTTAGFA